MTTITLRQRRALGWTFVVRDALGEVRHTAHTKRDAIAPYKGATARAQRTRRDGKPMTMRRSGMWLYLIRRGWTCTCEPPQAERVASAVPTTPPHHPEDTPHE